MKSLLAVPLLLGWAHADKIFSNRRLASNYLRRVRRDNNGIFEEIMNSADLKRECEDELCSKDEVIEAFHNDMAKANDWWQKATEKCKEPNACYQAGTETCINKWRSKECICRDGYTNEGAADDKQDCSTDVDECLKENHCANDGICDNTYGSFICDCPDAWEGIQCEIDVDECSAAISPCQNGGVCTNEIGSYSCACPPEFEGANCETDIDECQLDPCMNQSVCINNFGGYECLCNSGWGGQNCDVDYDECGDMNPCPVGSICKTDNMNEFTCVCPERGCNNLNATIYDEKRESVYENFEEVQVDVPEDTDSYYSEPTTGYEDTGYGEVNDYGEVPVDETADYPVETSVDSEDASADETAVIDDVESIPEETDSVYTDNYSYMDTETNETNNGYDDYTNEGVSTDYGADNTYSPYSNYE